MTTSLIRLSLTIALLVLLLCGSVAQAQQPGLISFSNYVQSSAGGQDARSGGFGPSGGKNNQAVAVGNSISGVGAIYNFTFWVSYRQSGSRWTALAQVLDLTFTVLQSVDISQQLNRLPYTPNGTLSSFYPVTAVFPAPQVALDPRGVYYLVFTVDSTMTGSYPDSAQYWLLNDPTSSVSGYNCANLPCAATPTNWGLYFNLLTLSISYSCAYPAASPSPSPAPISLIETNVTCTFGNNTPSANISTSLNGSSQSSFSVLLSPLSSSNH